VLEVGDRLPEFGHELQIGKHLEDAPAMLKTLM
jgi:hypothetical protein